MKSKFNVGDRVVNKSDLELSFSIFKEKHRKGLIQTVKEANEGYFNLQNETLGYPSAYLQSTGMNLIGDITILHLEKDRDKIQEILEAIEKEHQSTIDKFEKEIDYLRFKQYDVKVVFKTDMAICKSLLGLEDKPTFDGSFKADGSINFS